jgi:large subunit ribosomal protein L23
MSKNRASGLLTDPYAVIRRPIMTEKSHDMAASGGEGDADKKRRYTFEVHPKANKNQIRKAIEAAFGVTVDTVNTMIAKPRRKSFRGAGGGGKSGFSRLRKKAIVKLTKESKQIDLM